MGRRLFPIVGAAPLSKEVGSVDLSVFKPRLTTSGYESFH